MTAHPRPRDAAEYAALETPLRCDRAIRCGEIGASERERCLRETPRENVLYGIERGLKAGRYHFDPELAGDCLKLLAEAPCHVGYEVDPDHCLRGDAGLRPAVPPGGACERSGECIDGVCTGTVGCPGSAGRTRPKSAGAAIGTLLAASTSTATAKPVARPGTSARLATASWAPGRPVDPASCVNTRRPAASRTIRRLHDSVRASFRGPQSTVQQNHARPRRLRRRVLL
ncbi:hypothetical protein [Nannocystis pusilla]|uniref:hypothetical protein n=1 Tax=Nannocystis pusilla TaxID=889268 RepID=UPI003B80419D